MKICIQEFFDFENIISTWDLILCRIFFSYKTSCAPDDMAVHADCWPHRWSVPQPRSWFWSHRKRGQCCWGMAYHWKTIACDEGQSSSCRFHPRLVPLGTTPSTKTHNLILENILLKDVVLRDSLDTVCASNIARTQKVRLWSHTNKNLFVELHFWM